MQDVRTDRHLYIGGSDIPIIMGISPFKSRFSLLLEKAQLEENDFVGNEYTEYGNVMEPKIRGYINHFLHKEFVEGKHINGDVRCHTDGEDETSILEIKTTSKVYDKVDEYMVYLVQLLFYMKNTGRNVGYLAVYNRPSDFNEEFDEQRLQLFSVNIEDYEDLTNKIENEVDKFRVDLEKVKANPFITEEELQPAELIEISDKLLQLEEQLVVYKKIEEEQKQLKARLKELMEKNSIKKWTTNNGVQITLIEDGQDEVVKVFDEKKFKEENEETYNNYLEEKIKKGRSGYIKITLPKGA